MSKRAGDDMNEDSLDKLRTLRVSSLDEEEDENSLEIDGNGVMYDEDDYDDDEDEDDEEEDHVTLGFVENPKNRWVLLRHLFPSKAGGVPAWLDPINLPTGRSCVCDICGEPLQFLLQVYAPLLEKESTFHRTLFVFMCPTMSCLLQDQHEQWKHHPEKASRSVKVLRCQLPRSNPFYSSEPPKHDETDHPSGTGAALCSWCGTWKGDKLCSDCRRSRYCSAKHQAFHWRLGHKIQCNQLNLLASDSGSTNSSAEIRKAASNTLWPELEIVNEDESEFDSEMSKIDGYANSLLDSNEDDGDKKSWASFHERITRAPEQVIRYSRHATSKPLWPMLSGRPSNADIPECNYCGSHRAFEFQILPQLLYYFGVKNDVDSLDWAAIVVYTCEASCEGSLAYKEEFAWVQIASQSTTVLR